MRRRLLAIGVAVSVSACASRPGAVASAGGAVLMAGAAVAADDCDDSEEFICIDPRPPLIALSVMFAVAAVVMWKRADWADERAALAAKTPPPPPPVPTAPAGPPGNTRTAEDTRAIAELTALMREAAHRPDCVQVHTIARRLHEIDPPSQTSAVASDPAIAACFAPAPAL